VAGSDLDKRIRMPEQNVFRFDGGMFERMQDAYRNSETGALEELWEEAQPFSREPQE
jgi:hypothetical protein